MKTLALLLALALQQPQTIRINYVNADLGDVIRSLATVLGVNVVLTDVPSRRITFQTPEPVPAPQVGAVLEAILESQGLVIVQTGPVAQVMPEEKRPTTGPVRVGKELPTPPPLGLVTQIVPLDYIRAEEGITLLKQVASKTARVEVVPRSNAALITDRGVNIARYLDLLRLRRRAPRAPGGCGGECPSRRAGPGRAHHDRTGPGHQFARDPYRAAQLLGAPGDDRAARRPAPTGAAGGVDRRGDSQQGEPVRHQLAVVHPTGHLGGLDARDRRRRRPADLRRHAAPGLSGPGRAAGQPGEPERARHPAGARLAHQRARALYAPRPRAEQRGSAHPGRQRGAVRAVDAVEFQRGPEPGGAVPQRGHAIDRGPHRQQRRLRHIPGAAGGEQYLAADDPGRTERPRDHHPRGGDERDREGRTHDRDRGPDR